MQIAGCTVDKLRNLDELRAFASLLAATTGVLICTHQRHFTLLASEPSSFLTMTHHRCGLVFLASFAWCLFETANLSLKNRVSRPVPDACCD